MNTIYEIVLDDIKKNFKDSKYSTSQLLINTELDKKSVRDAIKEKTNRSLSNYIRLYRLNHAQRLLKLGDKNISEIAYDSGFSSLSYFSKSFKDEFGYSPNASLNNVKLTKQFRTTIISIIQNKRNLSYLFYSLLLILLVIFISPYINIIQNSEKNTKQLMFQEVSNIKQIPLEKFEINDTIILSKIIRDYNIYWKLNDAYDWVELSKINDS